MEFDPAAIVAYLFLAGLLIGGIWRANQVLKVVMDIKAHLENHDKAVEDSAPVQRLWGHIAWFYGKLGEPLPPSIKPDGSS